MIYKTLHRKLKIEQHEYQLLWKGDGCSICGVFRIETR